MFGMAESYQPLPANRTIFRYAANKKKHLRHRIPSPRVVAGFPSAPRALQPIPENRIERAKRPQMPEPVGLGLDRSELAEGVSARSASYNIHCGVICPVKPLTLARFLSSPVSTCLRACLRRGFRRGRKRDSWVVALGDDTDAETPPRLSDRSDGPPVGGHCRAHSRCQARRPTASREVARTGQRHPLRAPRWTGLAAAAA